MNEFNQERCSQDVRQVDQDLLDVLRRGAMTVAEMTLALKVTATAVRQRLDRMLEMGMVDRAKVIAGRGRPIFRYELTAAGQREAGADITQLAEAMWHAISSLPSDETRNWLLAQVARRLGSEYRQAIAEGSLESRMRAMSELLCRKRVLVEVSAKDHLPVLDVHVCPFPDLTDEDERRDMCHLEQEMLSQALGQPMELSQCQLDGHQCCQFSPAGAPQNI